MCRSKKIIAIEAEFEEPFADSVKGFALMGYSRKAASEALEIDDSYFHVLCTRFNLHKYFRERKDYLRICKPPGGPGWPKGKPKPQQQKYSDEYLLELVAQYPRYNEFDRCAPVHVNTVKGRFGTFAAAKRLAKAKKSASIEYLGMVI